MNEKRIKDILHESINEILSERQNNQIKKVLKEELEKSFLIKEEDNQQKKKSVMSALNQDSIKNSQMAYALWPTMDKDEARSLFSRKCQDKEWHFDDVEINKLYQLIRKI